MKHHLKIANASQGSHAQISSLKGSNNVQKTSAQSNKISSSLKTTKMHENLSMDSLGLSPNQSTLSKIAEKLRLVHGKMQENAPKEENSSLRDNLHTNNGDIQEYLNDVSRALLAKYYDEQKFQKTLMARLENLEKTIKNQAALEAEALSKFHDIVEDAALRTQKKLHHRFVEQIKKTQTENSHIDDEKKRNLKSSHSLVQNNQNKVADSQTSSQFVSLQQQLADMEEKLDNLDENMAKNNIDTLQDKNQKKPSIIYTLANEPKKFQQVLEKCDDNFAKKQIASKSLRTHYAFAFRPKLFVAFLLSGAIVYGLYLQFNHIVQDLAILKF